MSKMGRTAPFVALLALLMLTDARLLQQTVSTQDGCQVISNTYLSGNQLSRYTDLKTQEECCKRCSNTPACEIWSYCPATEKDGCNDGDGYSESGGTCLVYSLKGEKPEVIVQGKETTWVSGAPSGKDLPTLPDPRAGICAPHNFTLLTTSRSVRRTDEDSVDECCTRCSNNPECDVWAYCNTLEKDKCMTEDSYEWGTLCIQYSLDPTEEEEATVEQQGPDTLWVSGYRDPESQFDVPEFNATAPESCSLVPYTLLTTSDRIALFDNMASATACCARCRNTPSCGMYAYCGAKQGDVCYTATYTEDSGTCMLYPYVRDETEVTVEQQGFETAWTSGFKYAEDNTFEVETPPKASCTTKKNTYMTGDSTLASFDDIPTDSACCARCANSPGCELWTWCPKSEKKGCFSPSGDRDPGTCYLFELNGEDPTTELEGSDTPWISGMPSEDS